MGNKKSSMVERIGSCLNCGKPITYGSRGAPRKFCSDKCRIKYNGLSPKKPVPERTCTCLNCGNTFEYTSRGANKKFCNEYCRMSYHGITPKEHDSVEKVCKYCNKTFLCSSSTPTKIYCSTECATAFYKNKLQTEPKKEILQEKRTCAYCGKEFIWISTKSNQKYCSSECTANANNDKLRVDTWTEERTCAFCGNTFVWSSTKSGQKYCSSECRYEANKINIRNYQKRNKITDEELRNQVYLKVLHIISKMDQTKGASFGGKFIDYRVIGDIPEKTRERVLKRDGYECQVCRRKDSLHLHHLIKRKNGGNHEAGNLITLCASCHRHIETGDIEHATKKCFRNVKKHHGANESNPNVDIDGLRIQLTALFEALKESPVGDNTEIMVCLDEAIDLIDGD